MRINHILQFVIVGVAWSVHRFLQVCGLRMDTGPPLVRLQLLQGDVFCIDRKREVEEVFNLLQGLPLRHMQLIIVQERTTKERENSVYDSVRITIVTRALSRCVFSEIANH